MQAATVSSQHTIHNLYLNPKDLRLFLLHRPLQTNAWCFDMTESFLGGIIQFLLHHI